jgi:beta-phosphoglucomutase-like phosphatase (HAD superfamily)
MPIADSNTRCTKKVKVEKAIVFDIDGTLIDSVDLHTRAWQEAFAQVGKQIRYTDLRFQIGKGADMLVPCFLEKREVRRLGPNIAKRQEKIFKKLYFQSGAPICLWS